jgi:hypothetical protein
MNIKKLFSPSSHSDPDGVPTEPKSGWASINTEEGTPSADHQIAEKVKIHREEQLKAHILSKL